MRRRHRVQPHPDHLTPADRRSPRRRDWKVRVETEVATETEQALTRACQRCGAPEGQPCTSLDGSPHASRLEGR